MVAGAEAKWSSAGKVELRKGSRCINFVERPMMSTLSPVVEQSLSCFTYIVLFLWSWREASDESLTFWLLIVPQVCEKYRSPDVMMQQGYLSVIYCTVSF